MFLSLCLSAVLPLASWSLGSLSSERAAPITQADNVQERHMHALMRRSQDGIALQQMASPPHVGALVSVDSNSGSLRLPSLQNHSVPEGFPVELLPFFFDKNDHATGHAEPDNSQSDSTRSLLSDDMMGDKGDEVDCSCDGFELAFPGPSIRNRCEDKVVDEASASVQQFQVGGCLHVGEPLPADPTASVILKCLTSGIIQIHWYATSKTCEGKFHEVKMPEQRQVGKCSPSKHKAMGVKNTVVCNQDWVTFTRFAFADRTCSEEVLKYCNSAQSTTTTLPTTTSTPTTSAKSGSDRPHFAYRIIAVVFIAWSLLVDALLM